MNGWFGLLMSISSWHMHYELDKKRNLNLLFDMTRWQVKEEDVEAVDRTTTSHDQQAFMEAICNTTATIARASAVVATSAHASVIVGQGGSSNLQRFKVHHPPTFKGGGDPMVADH